MTPTGVTLNCLACGATTVFSVERFLPFSGVLPLKLKARCAGCGKVAHISGRSAAHQLNRLPNVRA